MLEGAETESARGPGLCPCGPLPPVSRRHAPVTAHAGLLFQHEVSFLLGQARPRHPPSYLLPAEQPLTLLLEIPWRVFYVRIQGFVVM